MNLLEEVAAHLAWCGLGESVHWGRMPDAPDECVCVFSEGSAGKGARMRILNRACDTRTAYETAARIAEALEGFRGFLAGDGTDVRIELENAAEGLGADGKKRELYANDVTVYLCI